MSAVFVTATGTEIGKTHVTIELVRALLERGRSVLALKPVLSGFDPSRPEDSDTGRLVRAMGQPIDSSALARVTPWRFAAPLSPDMAAERAGTRIDWPSLLEFCRGTIESHARQTGGAVTLIEGIGGVMVPIDDRHTVLDWIAALRIPALLVAGSYLGTLSHTLTAAGMLSARGCVLAGVVINESPEQPVGIDETAAAIARFIGPVPIVTMPRTPAASAGLPTEPAAQAHAARERLADLVERTLSARCAS